MEEQNKWNEVSYNKGVGEVRFTSWKHFGEYVNIELQQYKTFVFRGHADFTWKLEPTLDRTIKRARSPKRQRHLTAFKYAVRGRRGTNPPRMRGDDDWWALGQHYGLSTPLLDWTESPFVAMFFAVNAAKKVKSTNYCIWALSQQAVRRKNDKIKQEYDEMEREIVEIPIVKLIRPQSDENTRLVNQRGLFTRGPNNIHLEEWIQKYHPSEDELELIKLIIPSRGVDDCLTYLNRMNINHSTLFPDLYGASEYCNMTLSVSSY